jgi:Family of unknown function (DUF6082)
MATIDDTPATSRSSAPSRIAVWSAGLVALTTVTLLAGVGVAAMLSRRGDAADWSKWSDVGQTFGVLSSIISGLALTALVVTARVQFREMQETRRELERQRLSLTRNHSELQRTAEANRGMLHLEILKLAIDDPRLAEVWPPFEPGLTVEQNRQYLYANIIYQSQRTWMKIVGHSDEDVLDAMRYLFTSPVIRDYWKAAARARSSLLPGTEEHLLAQKVDLLWRDYEAVAAARRDPTRDMLKDLWASDNRADRTPGAATPPNGSSESEAA